MFKIDLQGNLDSFQMQTLNIVSNIFLFVEFGRLVQYKIDFPGSVDIICKVLHLEVLVNRERIIIFCLISKYTEFCCS